MHVKKTISEKEVRGKKPFLYIQSVLHESLPNLFSFLSYHNTQHTEGWVSVRNVFSHKQQNQEKLKHMGTYFSHVTKGAQGP